MTDMNFKMILIKFDKLTIYDKMWLTNNVKSVYLVFKWMIYLLYFYSNEGISIISIKLKGNYSSYLLLILLVWMEL